MGNLLLWYRSQPRFARIGLPLAFGICVAAAIIYKVVA